MLQSMRGRTASILTKILFSILALSFVGWGVQGFITNIRATPPILVVGKVEMDGPQLAARIDRNLQMMQRSLGTKLDRAQMMQLGLYDQALNRLIGELLIEQEVQKLGIKVSDETLRVLFRSSPGLLKQDGSVDAAMLQQMAEARGYGNINAFLTKLRQEIGSSTVLNGLSALPQIPPMMEDGLTAFKFEQRTIHYVTLADNGGNAMPAPNAAQIADYEKQHPQYFTLPEYRKFSYATLSPAQLLPQITIKDEELRTIYTQRKAEFSRPERRQVEQIPFDSEDAAKQARAKLNGKAGFADLAKTMKLSSKDYQLGLIAQKDLPKDLADAAFALKEGEVSQPIKTDFGFSLLRVAKIEAAFAPSFEQIHDRLLTETKLSRATDLMYDTANKIESAIDNGANLGKIAAQFGLNLAKLPPIDAQGQPPAGHDKITLDKELLKAIIKAGFDLKSGEASRPIEMRAQNIYLFVGADEITPSALKPVAAAEAEIIAHMKADYAREQGQTRAKALADSTKGGLSLGDAAKKSAASVTQSPLLDRNGRSSDGKNYETFPPQLLADLFKSDIKGEAVLGRSKDDKAWLVAQVAEIKHAGTVLSPKDRQLIQQELARGLQNDLIEQYINGLKQHYKVEVNRAAFAKLF